VSLLDPRRVPFKAPASTHRDARWYRSAATKTSTAKPDELPVGRESDDVAWVAVSHLVAGIVLYGGLGWLLGRWLGNQSLFVAGGVVLGAAFALYLVFARLGVTGSEPETKRQDSSELPLGGRTADVLHRGAQQREAQQRGPQERGAQP
jgi:F0F1-type ATP synthase assembly protein I